RVAAVRSTAARLAQDAETTGAPRLAETLGAPVVRKLTAWLELDIRANSFISSSSSRVASAGREQPTWPRPPAEAAFHGLPGRIVQLIEPHTESDRTALLLQMLVVFGNIIGRTAHFCVDGTTHYLNLFVVLVGRTGKSRKGTSWNRIKGLFSSIDRAWT